MPALAAVVAGLQAALPGACPTSQLSLRLDGDATVKVERSDADEGRLVVDVVYMEPGSYPSSSVLVCCDAAPPKLAERLSSISERFQEHAPLSAILSKACRSGSAAGATLQPQPAPTPAQHSTHAARRLIRCCRAWRSQVCDVLDVPLNDEPLRSAEAALAGGATRMQHDGSGSDEVRASRVAAAAAACCACWAQHEQQGASGSSLQLRCRPRPVPALPLTPNTTQTNTRACPPAQAMSEDEAGASSGDESFEDGDDEQEDKELLIECGQRQVSAATAALQRPPQHCCSQP